MHVEEGVRGQVVRSVRDSLNTKMAAESFERASSTWSPWKSSSSLFPNSYACTPPPEKFINDRL